MPAIDLARLRKQANQLADFFFLPEDFLRHLREMMDFYVNRTLRKKEEIAPGSNLPTYRTPSVVIRQIENAIGSLASASVQNFNHPSRAPETTCRASGLTTTHSTAS